VNILAGALSWDAIKLLLLLEKCQIVWGASNNFLLVRTFGL
jgi:hypothetical protein